MKSHAPGRELAALGRGGEALPMLKSIGDDSTARSARAGRRAACGPVDGAGAAQTRQILHRTREVVASII